MNSGTIINICWELLAVLRRFACGAGVADAKLLLHHGERTGKDDD